MPFRSSTAGEQTVLAATFRKTWYRVDIADPNGVMVDMSDHEGYGWLCDVTTDEHIDQPIAGITVTLRRELDYDDPAESLSLSPLRTDSAANPSGPQVDVYRAIKFYVATVTGNRPSSASTDWKLKLDGVTDSYDMPTGNTIVVTARDKGAHLQDQWVRDEGANIGGNRPLEEVINDLLRYAPVDGTVQTVNVPTDPSFAVSSFPLKPEPVMTAIQRAAELSACDFRYAWDDASGTYKPTLTVPDRSSPSSAATFASSHIVGWRRIGIDRRSVRNVVIVSYRPKNATFRDLVTVEDATSIATYGRRVITIQEADDSGIDSETEATDLANLILADLKDPKAEAEIEILPDWRVEVNDYLTFSANKYFDIDQELAVVGIRGDYKPNAQRMLLTLRGQPSAGYRRWIERAKDLDFEQLTPADNGLTQLKHTDDDTAGTRTYTWERGPNVAFVAFYENLAAAPLTASAWPDAGSVVTMVAAGTSGASILPTVTNTWVATRPPRGKQRFGILVPYYKLGGRTVQGDALKLTIEPLPSNMSARLFMSTGTSTLAEVDLVLWVTGSASDWPVTVDVWEGNESGPADYSYTLNANTVDADALSLYLKDLVVQVDARSWSVKATNVAEEVFRSAYTEPLSLGPTSQGSVSINEDGSVALSIDGAAWVDSYKYATSTSAFPSDATAIAGSTASGRQVTVSLGAATLGLGDTIYATFVPYSAAGVAGYSIRVRGTRHDASNTTTTHSTFAALTERNPGAYGEDQWYIASSGYVANRDWPGTYPSAVWGSRMVAILTIPDGVTITGLSADMYVTADVSGSVATALEKIGADGTITTIATATTNTSGWQTKTASCSESTTGNSYRVYVALDGADPGLGQSRPADDDLRASIFSYTYTRPSTALVI